MTTEYVRPLPDPKVCKTRPYRGTLWECLVEDGKCCPHNMNYGAEYYCLHTNSGQFIIDVRRHREQEIF